LADTVFGIVLLVAGLVFRARLPKKISDFVGYRTARSMKNQDTWEEANKYSARMMIRFSLTAITVGFVCGLLLKVPGVFISEGFALTTVFYMIYLTEKHLKTLFDEDGNRLETKNK
jgi:uncharacterized membrane protein